MSETECPECSSSVTGEQWEARMWDNGRGYKSKELSEIYCGETCIVSDLCEDEVKAICDAHNTTLAQLQQRVEEAERDVSDFENREGAICPEDYGFEEWITVLQKRLTATEQKLTVAREALEKIEKMPWSNSRSPYSQIARTALRSMCWFGRIGEFTDSAGRVCQCRVIGIDGELLVIDYYNQDLGCRFTGAVIGIKDFRE